MRLWRTVATEDAAEVGAVADMESPESKDDDDVVVDLGAGRTRGVFSGILLG